MLFGTTRNVKDGFVVLNEILVKLTCIEVYLDHP